MIFCGTPGLCVTVTRPKHNEPKAFRFNKSGRYETNIPSMIRRMTGKFEEYTAPTEEAQGPEQPAPAEESLHQCKKCDFKTNNKGLYMAHCRQQHPKES